MEGASAGILAVFSPGRHRQLPGASREWRAAIAIWPPRQPGEAKRASSLVCLNAHRRILFTDGVFNLSSLTAIVLGSVYGMEVAEEDPHIATFEKGFESVEFLISNSSLLEYLPAIGRVPTWLPGAGLLRRVAEIRQAVLSIRNTPWDHWKEVSVRLVVSLVWASPVILFSSEQGMGKIASCTA